MTPNKQFFTQEQIKSGEFTEFLNILLKQCYGKSEYYNDIHIMPEDAGLYSIEWVQKDWGGGITAGFEFIDMGQTIYTEYKLPDGTYIDLLSQDQFDDYLKEWLEENPGWVKTYYGTWTNEIENQKIAAALRDEENGDADLK